MHLFIELTTFLFFLATVAHAVHRRKADGAWLLGALLFAGFVRENFVVLRSYLYGFAPLDLMLGKAPLIASIIWGYSIYLAVVWAEGTSGETLSHRRPTLYFQALIALFMMALACFYEPFLKLIGMARWEEGTRVWLDVPRIALIGYPTFAVPFLYFWTWVMAKRLSTGRCIAALITTLMPFALAHAAGLQALKDWLSW